jgi:hypothetical protein
MAVSWLTALKVIPWGDVIEHAPAVLKGARRLLERQTTPPPAASEGDAAPTTDLAGLQRQMQALEQQHQIDVAQMSQTLADLAEQNARLVAAVELLRLRTRWLMAGLASMAMGLMALALYTSR